jgi:hypothetical protein
VTDLQRNELRTRLYDALGKHEQWLASMRRELNSVLDEIDASIDASGAPVLELSEDVAPATGTAARERRRALIAQQESNGTEPGRR